VASLIRLDTHVVVWMYTGEVQKLSSVATELLETCDLMISPIVQLELGFLHETGRLTVASGDIVGDLASRVGLRLSPVELIAAVHAAAPLTWTRDPFDRLIAGDALAANSQLLTKDHLMLQCLSLATW
jgi:PIN domain nuclease of toxin-antitoxin system